MYNEEIKMRYLDALVSGAITSSEQTSITQIRSVFNLTKNHEQKFGKDLGEFSKEEVIQTFTEDEDRSPRTIYTYSMRVKRYCEWYAATIKPGVVQVDWNISLKELKERQQSLNSSSENNKPKIISKDLIDRLVEIQQNPIQKLILSGLYYGLCGNYYSNLTTLKISNIIGDRKIQLYDWKHDTVQEDRIIEVPEQIIDYINLSCETYKFYVPNPASPKNVLSQYILTGEYALKGSSAEVAEKEGTLPWVRQRSSMLLNRMSKALLLPGMQELPSLKLIYISGLVNSLNTQAQIMGISVNKLFSKPEIEPILLQYGKQGSSIYQVKFSLKEYL